MKKILIISYFFAPCNLTPSARITYWAKNLNRFGYYPVIITRNWDRKIRQWEDTFLDSGEFLQHIREESYEVYHLPYTSNLRDKMYLKFNKKYTRPIYFAFRLLEVLSLAVSNFFIPYRNMYSFADNYLKQHQDIRDVIISASPFYLFRFGYLLKKRHPINWIADYRDDWTTNQIQNANLPFLRKIINNIEQSYEKKWVKSASTFITVSDFYREKIGTLLKKKGHCVYNGYDESILEIRETLFPELTFSYSGITYPSQQVERLLEVFNKLIVHYTSQLSIRINFIGTAYNVHESERLHQNIPPALKAHYHITPFLPREEALNILAKSHLLFIMAYGDNKGIPSSKLYEYIGLRKPIFLYPNDRDIIEQIISETGQGIIAGNAKEAFTKLARFIENFRETGQNGIKMDRSEIQKYSRYGQLKKLPGIIEGER